MKAIGAIMADARTALRSGRAEEALQCVEQVLASRPRNLAALTLRANCLIGLERLSEAGEAFQNLAEAHPDHPEAFLGLARVSEKAEKWKDALINWRNYAEASGEDIEPRLRLAKAALRLREAELALQASEEILEIEPGHEPADLLRARALQALGRFDEAEAHFLRLMHAQANSADTVIAVARFAAAGRRWDLFKSALQHLQGCELKDDRALEKILPTLVDAGWFGEAITLVRRMRTSRPVDHLLWYREHWLLTRLGDLEGREVLLADARTALATWPLELALLLERIGCFDEAAALRREAASSQPRKEVRRHLAHYRKLGRIDAVHQLLAQVPNPADFAEQAAWLKQACRRTATDAERLRTAEAEPLDLSLRAFERLVELGHRSDEAIAPLRRIAICNNLLRGIGGAQRATTLALKALTTPHHPFDRLMLVTVEEPTKERSDEGLGHLLEDMEVERLLLRPSDAPLPTLVEQDPDWHAAWLDLLALLPREIRRQVLGTYNLLAEARPDKVIIWGSGPPILLPMGLGALMARTQRIVVTSRGIGNLDFSQSDRIVGSAVASATERGYLRAFLSLPQVSFMACSRSLLHEVSRLLSLDLSGESIVYNAVLEEFLGTPDQARSRPLAGPPTVGGLFRHTLVKQPFLWLEVARHVHQRLGLHDVRFVLVGDGPLFAGVRDRVRDLGLEERFTLVGETQEVARWLGRMDLCLHTSMSEGLGNSLLEAQLCGVPVVTTDCGSAHEVVQHGETGWVVDSMEPEAIAERVCWCLTQEAWLAEASVKARRFVRENFTLERMRADLLRVLGVNSVAPPQVVQPR